jgi:hypothetical protein
MSKERDPNREAWLNVVMDGMKPWFATAGSPLPENIRISCGFPVGHKKAIGQCFLDEASEDKHFEIFIHPGQAEPERVAGILCHELTHVAVGFKAKHGLPFKRVATKLGLEGKMTSTTEGELFLRNIAPVIRQAGKYPHAALTGSVMSTGPKKQGTRMIKCQCPECEYTVRTSGKWIEVAVPTCPNQGCGRVGQEMEVDDTGGFSDGEGEGSGDED